MRKVYPSQRVCCPHCDYALLTSPIGREYHGTPEGFEPRDGDRILWADDGFARCPDCGHHLKATVGGWTKRLRWQCQGCGHPLTGRQVRWCNQPGLGVSNLCSVAWDNPSLLAVPLTVRQQGLCGICCRPIRAVEHIEVDHVVPLTGGGERRLLNLRATHRGCNQAKKARPLAEARVRMGLTDTEVLRRLAGAEVETVVLLRGPPLDELRAA